MPAFSQPPMRRFGDHDATRDAVFDTALGAVKSLPPAENSRYKLELTDPQYVGQQTFSQADHTNAILEGRTLGRRIAGTFKLTDKASNAVVDSRRLTVAHVPYLTRQGTFVYEGSPLAVSSQLRLMPGVYTRRKGDGTTEGHVNFIPGQGVPHRLGLDPESGVFKVNVGQAEIPAAALLKALGTTDDELKAAWGPELTARNLKATKPHHLDKLYEKFGPAGPVPDDKAAVIASRLSKYPLDPWVMSRTLGAPHKTYGKDVILATTRKLLGVARGTHEPDDRDNPAFSTVWGPEHLIAERLRRATPLLNKALWAITNVGNLKRLQPGLLSPAVRHVFTHSGLALNPEGASAAEYVDHGAKITKIGEGGIGRSSDAAPMSSRNVNPGQIPFIDHTRASESDSVGLDLRVAFGTRLGADNRIYAPLRDRRTNKLVYRSPQDTANATVAFPEINASADALVPAVHKGKLTYVPRHKVDYVIPSMEQTFSPLTNMVPLKSAGKPHRSSMGARMITQSIPLTNAEAPLVRTQVPGQPGKSFEELFGPHMGAVRSRNDSDGTVTGVTPQGIAVTYDDGRTETHELYHHHPAGRTTGIHNTPVVQPGQRIEAGTLLAPSNFTDHHGHAAYGKTARVGFMIAPGVYEDAIRVSRSFADKLKSDHLDRHSVETAPDTVVGRTAHAAAFPGLHTLETLKAIDQDGVVKPGTVVGPGHPLILAVRKKEGGYGRLSRAGKVGWSDASEVWEHDEPGTVVGVTKTAKGPVVMVNSQRVLQSGDKLCYDPETEVLTRTGWKPIADVTLGDSVASMTPDGALEYLQPEATHSFRYDGPMYRLETTQVSLCVTPNHELYAKPVGGDYGFHQADALYGTRYWVQTRTGVETLIDRAEPEQSETWMPHSGLVYCVTLPRNHVLYVRRDAKPVWCGNSGRHGNKGVAVVSPDHEMPIGADGKPLEVILSSLGTISRTNPSAIFEAALGKIAAKTGKPYVVEDFKDNHSVGKFVEDELARHGVDFMEHLTDPQTGRTIPNVGVGNLYMMKLSHVAAKKAKGRGLGGYDETGQPLRGQSGKAMRMSLGDTNALLSHGATNVIRDAHLGRGQTDDTFWTSFMAGFPAPRHTTSKAFDRFLTELRAAGVNPVRKDSRYHLTALLDKDVREMAGDREVKNGETLNFAKNGEPIPGGLFDVKTFGATDSTQQWAKIGLHEPLPHPLMEEPIRRLLDLTSAGYRDVIAGRKELPDGTTGPTGIAQALGKIDVQVDLAKTRERAQSSRKTAREDANRKLTYLKGFEKTGVNPADLMTTMVPVLPPAYRPVSKSSGRNDVVVHDANLLYKDLIEANHALRDLSKEVHDTGDERLNLYDAVKAAYGIGDPVGAKNRERGVKGVLARLLGSTSKYSYMQQKLLGTPVDLSGRGQVLPNPDMDMDEIGLPESVAWEIYHPFVVRNLVREGHPRVEAARLAADRAPAARRTLVEEMDRRPVMSTRYPSLHRYNILGFRPRLVAGDAIQMNHLMTKSQSMDFDGNCVDFYEQVILQFVETDIVSSDVGGTFLTAIQEAAMRLPADQQVFVNQNGVTTARINIGDFPRGPVLESFGTPSQTVHGVPLGVSVLTYDHQTGRTLFAPVTQFTVDRDHPVVRVRTRHGREVIVSDNESLCVFDPEVGGVRKAKPATGLFIPCMRSEPHVGQRFDYDVGWWYGMLLSDGWVTERTVGLAKLDERKRDEFVRIAREKIHDNFTAMTYARKAGEQPNTWGAATKVHLNSASLVRHVFSCYAGTPAAGERSALYKQIPAELLGSGSEACLLGLLGGLLDGDGSVTWNMAAANKRFAVRVSTSSKYLADGVVVLCRRLGLRASITSVEPRGPSTHTAYIVLPSVVDFHRVAGRLRLIDVKKAAVLTEFAADPAPTVDNSTLIPIARSLATSLQQLPNEELSRATGPRVRKLLKQAIGTGYLNRQQAAFVLGELPADYDHVGLTELQQMVATEDIVWDPVVAVEPLDKREVYDLNVPDTKVFVVGSGIVVWDTSTINVPLSDEAVKEVYEKLLPSKNLFSPASMKATTFVPNMEYVQGLHSASTADDKNPPVEFRTRAEALTAYKRGEIGLGTRVKILD